MTECIFSREPPSVFRTQKGLVVNGEALGGASEGKATRSLNHLVQDIMRSSELDKI